MMKGAVSIVVFIFVSVIAYAQNIDSDLYWNNYFYVNPAFHDSSSHIVSFMAKRNNDQDFKGLVAWEANLAKINTHIGFLSYADYSGQVQLNTFGFAVNHSLNVGKDAVLTLGTKIYNQRTNIAYYSFVPRDGDPSLRDDSYASNWFADLGLLLKYQKLFAGLSAINLRDTEQFVQVGTYPVEGRRFNVMGGGTFDLGKHLKSTHSFYIPFTTSEVAFIDINSSLILKDKFSLGLTVRPFVQDKTVYDNSLIVSSGIEFSKRYKLIFLVHANGKNAGDDFRGEVMGVFKL